MTQTEEFSALGLTARTLEAIRSKGFEPPSPIQRLTIPALLDTEKTNDIIAQAQTGTGKTAAFGLPILERLRPLKGATQALILVPTRELALQVTEELLSLNGRSKLSISAIYGGASMSEQLRSLSKGVDVVVGTPGRILDHLHRGTLDIRELQYLILDEADRMLDMGFSEDIMKIVSYMPKDRQTIMFSATLPPKIREMARTILRNPAEVNIAISKPNEAIDQSAYVCYENQKLGIIREMFAEPTDSKTIIFSSSKLKVKELAHTLKRMKLNVAAMHSDLEQAQREEVMLDFKNNKVSILVATDIVARGIDIEDIGLVINYDVPHDPEDYIHRIGRTARAAATGSAVTFVSEDEQGKFHAIEKFIEKDIRKAELPASVGAGPVYNPAVNNGRGRGGRGGGRGRGGANGGSRGRGRADKVERAGRERRNDRERGAAAADNPGIAVPQAAPADNDHASGRGEGNRGTRDRSHRHRGGRNRRRGDTPQGGETPQPDGSVPRE